MSRDQQFMSVIGAWMSAIANMKKREKHDNWISIVFELATAGCY